MNNDTQQPIVSPMSRCLESKTSDRSSTVSAGSLDPWSLEKYVDPQQPIFITHQQHRPRVYIPEDIELTSYVFHKDTNYPKWAGSPQSTLVNEAGVSPVVRVSMMPPNSSQTSAQRNLTNLPASETIQDPPKAYGKWEKVRDPAALLGLSHPFCGTGNLAKGSRLVRLEGKILHAIFDKLDPVSATSCGCKRGPSGGHSRVVCQTVTNITREDIRELFADVSLTGIGLTCRKMNMFLKYQYSNKVSLYEPSPPEHRISNEGPLTLGDLVEVWMGPRYRRVVWQLNSVQIDHEYLPPQFLLRDVYGPCRGSPEEAFLAKRYLEYYSDFACRINEDIGKYFYILPHPHNMGKKWGIQAMRAIKEDAKEFRGRNLWHWTKWMANWMPSEVFRTMSYMDKLRVLQWFEYEEYLQTMTIDGNGRLLQRPGLRHKLWWTGKRYLRWVVWWIGDQPELKPFPPVEPGQIRLDHSVRRSVMMAQQYRESALLGVY